MHEKQRPSHAPHVPHATFTHPSFFLPPSFLTLSTSTFICCLPVHVTLPACLPRPALKRLSEGRPAVSSVTAEETGGLVCNCSRALAVRAELPPSITCSHHVQRSRALGPSNTSQNEVLAGWRTRMRAGRSARSDIITSQPHASRSHNTTLPVPDL